MITRRILLTSSLLLAIAGCKSKEKRCEHARDVMLAIMEAGADETLLVVPPEERAAFRADVQAELDHARGKFVGECTQLDDAGMECIDRIDEVVAARTRIDDAVDRAYGECPKDAIGLVEQGCIDFARKDATDKEKAAWKGPDCDATLDTLVGRVHEGAPTERPPADPAVR